MNAINIALLISIPLILGSLIVYLVVKFTSDKEPEDETKFKHYLKRYTEGHSEGKIIKVTPGKERTAVYFRPTDKSVLKYFNPLRSSKKEIQKVFIQNDKLIQLPRYTYSDHLNYVVGLPNDSSNLSESFKETFMGKVIMNAVAQKDLLKTELDIEKIANKRNVAHAKNHAYGSLTIEQMEYLKSLSNDQLKIISKEKEKEPIKSFGSN